MNGSKQVDIDDDEGRNKIGNPVTQMAGNRIGSIAR